MLRNALLTFVLGTGLALCPTASQAGLILDVSLDTSPLIDHPAGPFAINFQLIDGSGSHDGNTQFTIGTFQFHGGTPDEDDIDWINGASGSLSTEVTLTNSDFWNEFTQGFTPGNRLSFTVQMTAGTGVGETPISFSFAILDSFGFEIPTQDFNNTFLTIDLTDSGPAYQTFASDPEEPPAAGGDPIIMGTPTVSAVPEPSTLAMAGTAALLGLAHAWRRRRTSRAA